MNSPEPLHDLDSVVTAADPEHEFIVKVDFYHSNVSHVGFRILTTRALRELLSSVHCGAKICAPNMPGHWSEEFNVGLLKEAFSIHSADPDDVDAMRRLFGEEIGETSLFDQAFNALNAAKEHCQVVEVLYRPGAELFVRHPNPDPFWIENLRGISPGAAQILAGYSGDDLYFGAMEDAFMTSRFAEAIARFKGRSLGFGENIRILPDECARHLAEFKGEELSLSGLSSLSDAAATSLAHFQGRLHLPQWDEMSMSEAARALLIGKLC